MTKEQAKKRLEEIRKEIKKECVSYGEIAELQDLKDYIEEGDVELLEWAGVKEKTYTTVPTMNGIKIKETNEKGELIEEKFKQEDVEDCIGYAVKEGYLDEDVARKMTWKEKCDYRDRCDSVEPYDETPW